MAKEHIYYGNKILECHDGSFLSTKMVDGEIQEKTCFSMSEAKAFIRKPRKQKTKRFTQFVSLTLSVEFDAETQNYNTAAKNVMSQKTFNKLLGPVCDGVKIINVKFR